MREQRASPQEPPDFIDWSDEKLNRRIREIGKNTDLDYVELVAELNRRATNRQARATMVLSIVSAAIAIAAIIVTVMKP